MITPEQLRNAARFGQHLRPETLEWLADQLIKLAAEEEKVKELRKAADKYKPLVEAAEYAREVLKEHWFMSVDEESYNNDDVIDADEKLKEALEALNKEQI